MRLLTALIFSLLATPCFANNYATGTGNTPIIVFRNHATTTNEIDYCPADLFVRNSADDAYDFVSSANDTNATHYTNNLGSYSYTPPAARTGNLSAAGTALPAPDPRGFLTAVIASAGVTSADIQAATAVAWLVSQGATSAQLKTAWAALSVFVSHPTQLASLASQFNCPVQ